MIHRLVSVKDDCLSCLVSVKDGCMYDLSCFRKGRVV